MSSRLVLVALGLLAGCAGTSHSRGGPRNGSGSHCFPSQTADALFVGREAGCTEDEARPPGWPRLSSGQEVLAPFLSCISPAEFIELQRTVDMARVVEGLDEWSAVRLGSLGPLRTDAAEVLNRKRAAFLVTATREYGVVRAELFALFLIQSAFGDDLRQVLVLLARDKLRDAMGTVRSDVKGVEVFFQ